MRVITLALLFFLAAASQAAAATKVIRFGKLIDGMGRVFTNAVVVAEDDRVQRVASGNVPIPPGAEVIDLSRYTGIPGLIDTLRILATFDVAEEGSERRRLSRRSTSRSAPATHRQLCRETSLLCTLCGADNVLKLKWLALQDGSCRQLLR
jgi:hypothetical protein